MKFGQCLAYNAVPDWLSHYMAYDQCKHMLDSIKILRNRKFYASTPSTSADGEAHGDESSDDENNAAAHSRRSAEEPTLGRSASQAVLLDIEASSHQKEGPGSSWSFPSRKFHRSDTVEENLTVRQLSSRIDALENAFFEKLAAEANKVDTFYSKMMTLLPRHHAEHIQRIAQLVSFPVTPPHTSSSESRAQTVPSSPLRTSVASPPAHMHSVNETTRLLDSTAASSPESTQNGHGQPLAPPLLVLSPLASIQDRMHVRDEELKAMRAKVCRHYLDIVGMINFSKLNWDAFDKILKKHDKISSQSTRAGYVKNLEQNYKFTDASGVLRLREETEALFADTFTHGNVDAAKEELLEGVREQIIWSRNTVWRDMLRTEGKTAAVQPAGPTARTASVRSILTAVVVFSVIMYFPSVTDSLPVPGAKEYSTDTLNAAHRCLALLAGVVVLWAQEGLPLYVTSFLVLPGTVLLRLLLDANGSPLPASTAAKEVFRSMSSSTLMLIVCVYTLHAALSKFNIDKRIASEVLTRVDKAQWLLLSVMMLSVITSMLVSNVAAPVLLNSLVLPVLGGMPRSSRPFVQCVLLGIAVASNIGGMPSPIASPQNTVAFGMLRGEAKMSFMEWLVVALPLVVCMVLVTYGLLVLWFRPQKYRLPKVPPHKEAFSWQHAVILVTFSVTVMLWIWHRLSRVFGSAGIVAVIPIIVFYGSGILNKTDFNNLPWNVVYLVAGGMVLGAAVESSRLLYLIADKLHFMLSDSSVWTTFAVFCGFMAVAANMISHTVSAIIILPIVNEVGVASGHPQLLVVGSVLACSSAMSLPVSSFPNMAALSATSELHEAYLTSMELLKVGVPMTAVCALIIVTVGYAWMTSLGY